MNNLSISGTLLDIPNIVYTKSGRVANLTIKVVDNRSGGYDIFQADVWNEEYINKLSNAFTNQEIILDGSHHRRSYIDKKTGDKIYYWSMTVDEMQIMDVIEIEDDISN